MMEPVLPPTFIREFDSQRERISNAERLIGIETEELNLINEPAAINFVKYARANTNFDGTKTPSKVDRIQSNWVSLPYTVNISSVYVTHKTEHLNTPSFQDFYRCQIVVTSADLQPYKVLSEFTISLNKLNNLRSNPKAGLWQDEPLENESEEERYFQYEKQTGFEIKLPETVSIPADRRFSLIKYPIFAIEEDFALTDDDNLDIDVVVLNGLSSEPINITVESTLIKKVLPEPVNNIFRKTYTYGKNSEIIIEDGREIVIEDFYTIINEEPITLQQYESEFQNYVNPPLLVYREEEGDGAILVGSAPVDFSKNHINYPNYELIRSPNEYNVFASNNSDLAYYYEKSNYDIPSSGYVHFVTTQKTSTFTSNSSFDQNDSTFTVLNPKVLVLARYTLPLFQGEGQDARIDYLFEKTLSDYQEEKNNFEDNGSQWLLWYKSLYSTIIGEVSDGKLAAYIWNPETQRWEKDFIYETSDF